VSCEDYHDKPAEQRPRVTRERKKEKQKYKKGDELAALVLAGVVLLATIRSRYVRMLQGFPVPCQGETFRTSVTSSESDEPCKWSFASASHRVLKQPLYQR